MSTSGHLNAQGELDFRGIPFQGATAQSRHASYTGAQAVREEWSSRMSDYLQALRASGGMTDHEAESVTGYSLSSINSVRSYIRKHAEFGVTIEACGFDTHEWVDKSGKPRSTKRTIWRLAR